MEDLKGDLIKKINEKIKDNKIKMKPKFYFVLQGFLLMSFVLIIFLAAIYIGNFILLILHERQEAINFLYIDSFDFNNFLEFLKIIPGFLILLLFVFIFSLYKLIKDLAFVYRKNVLYIILFLFLFLTLVIINIHTFLDKNFDKVRFGEKGELPVVFYLHKYYRGNNIIKINSKNLNNQLKFLKNKQLLDD